MSIISQNSINHSRKYCAFIIVCVLDTTCQISNSDPFCSLRPLKKIMPPPRKNTSRNPLKSLQKREDVEDDFNQEPEQPQAAVDEFDQIKSNEL